MDGGSGHEDDSVDDPDGSGGQHGTPGESGDSTRIPESDSLFDQFEGLTVFRVVVGITLLALVLRLVALGARAAHWDEARVAYWAHFYADTGSLAYHYEEHGPFVQLVAGRLFDILGTSDFVARLPVAVVGGLLPLSALLYREHLRKTETVALALFLAANPILLYYSRFMRSDVLVATFMFVTLGLLVRAYDTRRPRYLYGAVFFAALGFASKENAIVYVLTWVGAAALLADQRLYSDDDALERLRAWLPSGLPAAVESRQIARRLGHLVGVVAVALVTTVFLFAPRGAGIARRYDTEPTGETLNLGTALSQPTRLVELGDETLRSTYDEFTTWFEQSSETTFQTYFDYLVDGYLGLFAGVTPFLVVFVLAGIALERYARDDPRPLVMFLSYCGVASLIGYPIASHIQGDWGWISTHIVVPLTVPAAVGLAWTYRTVKREVEYERGDLDPTVVVGAVVILGLLWFAFVPYGPVYADHQSADNELVQFAQPNDDVDPMTDSLEEIAASHDGTDVVVFYGKNGVNYDEVEALVEEDFTPGESSGGWLIHPTCSIWSNTQPLNWYFAATGAETTCERSANTLTTAIGDDPPPMIITLADDETVPAQALAAAGYESRTYYMRTIGSETTVYTHESWR